LAGLAELKYDRALRAIFLRGLTPESGCPDREPTFEKVPFPIRLANLFDADSASDKIAKGERSRGPSLVQNLVEVLAFFGDPFCGRRLGRRAILQLQRFAPLQELGLFFTPLS
jgi:hypothetical protein